MASATNPKRFSRVAILVAVLLVTGTCGYAWVESWPWYDGFYMTLITLSTVGFGETHDLSQMGRWFTCGLIAMSLVVMTFWTACLTSLLIEGDLKGTFTRRRMMRMISKMSGHTIVCGSGLMAQAVVERLQRRNIPVVVVTPDAQDVDPLQSRFPDLAVVVGDATNELVLGRANVWTAEHVIAATDRDVDNLLIGISCKDLGRPLTVIARSESPQIANRMRKAGVDEVICPVDLIGQRVSEMIPVG